MRNRRRRGQALVESALIMIVFLAVLIGIVDIGQVLFVQQSLVERVRWATRWAVVQQPFDADKLRNMVMYAQPIAPSGSGAPSFLGLNTSNINVVVSDAGTEEARVTVGIVNYNFYFFNPLVPRVFSGSNVASESMPLE